MISRSTKLSILLSSSILLAACGSDQEGSIVDSALNTVKDGASAVVEKTADVASDAASATVDAASSAVEATKESNNRCCC